MLWVKGSGGDVGTMKLDGFATLYMDEARGAEGALPRRRARGRDGGLPAALHLRPQPARRLDRHAAARLRAARATSTTCTPTRSSPSPPRRTREALTARGLRRRDRLAAVEAAGLRARPAGWRQFCRENPEAKGVVLESHGLFTWGDDAQGLLRDHARDHQPRHRLAGDADRRQAGLRRRRGTRRCAPEERRRVAAALMPAIRGMVSKDARMVGHFDDQRGGARVRQRQATWRRWRRSAPAAPTISCAPRSGRWWWTSTPATPDLDATLAGLPAAVEAYRADYAAYYERCRRPDSPALRDPNAVVYLVPGVGMITFAKDKATARISGEFYVNAINVMRGASAVSRVPRPAGAGGLRHRVLAARGGEAAADAEAEEPRRAASRSSPAAPAASARRPPSGCSREGACVVLADIDAAALAETAAEPRRRATRRDVVRTVEMNVTSEDAVAARLRRDGGGVRRRRHRRLQRRHRLVGADRGDHARALEPQHVDPRRPATSWSRARRSGC